MKVFISCVAKKKNVPALVKDIYISSLFTKSLDYARTLTSDENIFILSAKHGVLKLNDYIEPYDQTLNTMNQSSREEWYSKVAVQLKRMDHDFKEPTCILAGKRYYDGIIHLFQNVQLPLDGLMLGQRLQFLNNVKNHNKKQSLGL